jgi:ubiquinol-cytochrome c reductase cytochrome c1 subunit
MNRLLIICVGWTLSLGVHAAAVTTELLPVQVRVQDKPTLQRGARLFMNYCSGCHSLRYLRYNRMAQDLGLTTFDGQLDRELLMNNLVFTTAQPTDPIEISMPAADARQWFGRMPPDLSLVAREHGAAWLYTYLNSFYRDDSRPFGTNNLLVPGVGMPNVLAHLEGEVIAAVPTGAQAPTRTDLRLQHPGEMSRHQFDSALEDLVTFLVYVGEPAQLVRYRAGAWVMLFLGIFLVFAYLLKQSYWRALKR